MRSTEFLSELNFPNSRDDAEKRIQDAGYVNIGSGSNATVFNKPDSPYALKLFDSADKAYIDYVRLCINNPNPHFPKFKGKMMKVTSNYYAVRMEKLNPNPKSYQAYKDKLGESYSTKDEIADLLKEYGRTKEIYPDLTNLNAYRLGVVDKMNKLNTVQPGIREAVDLISDIPGVKNDIHWGNIMFRGETLVIIDPVYDPKSLL